MAQQQQQTAEHRVDNALSKAQPSVAATAAGYQIAPGTNAVRSSTQITLGGYTEFTYINRDTRTPEFNQLKTVAEISARINDRINLYIEAEEEQRRGDRRTRRDAGRIRNRTGVPGLQYR